MDSIKKWMAALDTEAEQPINESVECKCALYTCKACFPDHFPANDTLIPEGAELSFSVDDVVKIDVAAGDCLATVTETKGQYLKVIRESDNATILIHYTDAKMHEAFVPGMEAGELDLDFPDAADNGRVDWGDVRQKFGDAPLDTSEMVANIISYQDMDISNDDRRYTEVMLDQLTPEAIKRIHAKVVGEQLVESSEDTDQFDAYERACKKKHGRVIGRSKFLALSPEERAAAIHKLQS